MVSEVREFMLSDLVAMRDAKSIQARHAAILDDYVENHLEKFHVLENKWAKTVTVDGQPAVSCGIINGWAWAFLAEGLGPTMVKATRHVRDHLDRHLAEVGPIRADIDNSFHEGVRWAAILGFRPETDGVWIFDHA